MLQMKRDYYRELDQLRCRSRKDGSAHADSVIFFDPSSYQIPPWQTIVDELDERRRSLDLVVVQQDDVQQQTKIAHILC